MRMYVTYRFEGQGVILESGVCSTTPLKLSVNHGDEVQNTQKKRIAYISLLIPHCVRD